MLLSVTQRWIFVLLHCAKLVELLIEAVIYHVSTLKTGMKVEFVQEVTGWKLLILLPWLINSNNLLSKLNWAE